MFYWNIKMFYIGQKGRDAPVREEQLLDLMLVSGDQRSLRDHQLAFSFFNHNQQLEEIERTRSLNARLKCVAGIELVGPEQINFSQHLVLHRFEDLRAVILRFEVIESAKALDQKSMRGRMDRLGTFSSLKSLGYSGLLYLGFYMDEKSCKFKEYLYRQGEVADYAYFVEEGQFSYVKDSLEGKSRFGGRKGKKGLRSVDEGEDNTNRKVRGMVKKYQIGIVEGGLGQTVGLEQLALGSSTRKYSVVCNSTNNKLIRVSRECLHVLFEDEPEFHERVRQLVSGTSSAKVELINRIRTTKSHMKEIIKKTIDHSQAEESGHFEKDNSKSSFFEVSMSRYKLPILQRRASVSTDRPKLNGSALSSKHLRESQNIKPQEGSFKVEPQQDQGIEGFGLTGVRQVSSKSDKISLQQEFRLSVDSKKLQLPLITKKSVADLDFLPPLGPELLTRSRSKLSQYGGMIDAVKMVQQKRLILDKKITNTTRIDLFPSGHVEYRRPRKQKVQDPMKLRASPAHSHRFMENMLLKALKRAGYDEQQTPKEGKEKEKRSLSMRSGAHSEFSRRMKVGSRGLARGGQLQLLRQEDSVLVRSAFDECYFKI